MSRVEIIAECGINHAGDMRLAKEMIRLAKINGADVAKFQLSDVDSVFPDKKIISGNKNWYNEVKKTQLSKEQVFELANCCREIGIEFFASATDLERLGWLEEVGVKRHKIATRMNQNKEYIKAVCETNKEVLLSCRDWTGIYILFDYMSPKNIKYLYCIPEYPTPLSNLQLQYVDFEHEYSGLSDHTEGIEASTIAMARGARIIEKHFCLKRDNSNPDMVCSIEPQELRQLVDFARKVEEVL